MFYLDDRVQQGHSCPTISTAVAVVCLRQQPLDLIWLLQLILGFSLLFVTGIGLELEQHKAGQNIADLLQQNWEKNIKINTTFGMWGGGMYKISCNRGSPATRHGINSSPFFLHPLHQYHSYYGNHHRAISANDALLSKWPWWEIPQHSILKTW